MKTAKKILRLALSAVVVTGLLVMAGHAAEFEDANEIQHREAVNALVRLGIINGRDDGTFVPWGFVTRGQMAKMITVAMRGGDGYFWEGKTSGFTDVEGHWAENYIEYCFERGIISGRGDGSFDPDGNVTGVEASKMILVALGYDPTAYALAGPSWAAQTEKVACAAQPSLYKDLEGMNLDVAIDRDTAAQMLWNGVRNHTIKGSSSNGVGGTTLQYSDSENTFLEERFEAKLVASVYRNEDSNNVSNSNLGDNGRQLPKKLTSIDSYYIPEYAPCVTFHPDMTCEMRINWAEEMETVFTSYGVMENADTGKVIIQIYSTDGTPIVNFIEQNDGNWAFYGLKWGNLGLTSNGDLFAVSDWQTVETPLRSWNVIDELEGKKFVFSSGIGAWGTELTMGESGEFTGEYHDSNYESGENYDGTILCCGFRGKFSDFTPAGDCAYKMRLTDFKVETEAGTEYVKDGVRYIFTGPYGMENASDFYLYLPGKTTTDLSEEFMGWITSPTGLGAASNALPFMALYNVGGQTGFFESDHIGY